MSASGRGLCEAEDRWRDSLPCWPSLRQPQIPHSLTNAQSFRRRSMPRSASATIPTPPAPRHSLPRPGRCTKPGSTRSQSPNMTRLPERPESRCSTSS